MGAIFENPTAGQSDKGADLHTADPHLLGKSLTDNATPQTGSDSKVALADSTDVSAPNKLQEEGLACWTQKEWTECKAFFSSITGGQTADAQAANGQAANGQAADGQAADGQAANATNFKAVIAFDNCYGSSPTDATNVPPVISDATTAPQFVYASDLIGRHARHKTEITAVDGTTHYSGENIDGISTSVDVTKNGIDAQVGAAHIEENKETKEVKYNSGEYSADVNGPTVKVSDANGDQLNLNRETGIGSITGKDGKSLLSIDTNNQTVSQEVAPNTLLTQTNRSAETEAAALRARMQSGEVPEHTGVVADHNGNFAIVRKDDGLVIKTDKSTGEVTVERNGETIRVTGHRAERLLEDAQHHQHWQEMHAGDAAGGLELGADGGVKLQGKTLVSTDGHVTVSPEVSIDAKSGNLKSTYDGGITVSNNEGKTTVTHAGVSTIVSDGHTFVNTDPKTQNIFKSWDPEKHTLCVFAGEGHAGVSIDTRPQGTLTITESNGQTTAINPDGSIQAKDAQGKDLMSVDSSGKVKMSDGTTIGADGSVSGGAASGSDNGASASAAIANAIAAMSAANAAVSSHDTSGATLAALDACQAELSGLAPMYSAINMLDVVTRLDGMAAAVGASRSAIEAKLSKPDGTA